MSLYKGENIAFRLKYNRPEFYFQAGWLKKKGGIQGFNRTTVTPIEPLFVSLTVMVV